MRKASSIVLVLLSAAFLFGIVSTFAEDKEPEKPVVSEVKQTPDHNFGIFCNLYNKDWEDPEKTVALLKELGVKIAICKLSWKDVEKEKGKFSEEEWKAFDEMVDKFTGCGIDVMCLVAAIPEWTKKGTALNPASWRGKKPRDPQDLVDFVTVAARRYKDKIKRWTLFNSPQGKRHWIKPRHLVELYRVGSQAIKSEIPDSVIVMAGLEGIVDKRGPYLEKFLKAGGGKYVDMYDFHMNLGAGVRFSASASMTNALKDILKKYGQSGKPIQYGAIATPSRHEPKEKKIAKLKAKGWKPIDFEFITSELQAIRLVTLMIWGRSLGIDRIFWTRTRDQAPESGPEYEEWLSMKKRRRPFMPKVRGFNRTMGVIDYDYKPKPSFFALKTLIEKLDTAVFLKELNVGEDAKAFIFQKEGKYVGVFWTWQGERSLTLGTDAKSVTVSDLYGKIITHADINNGKLTLRLTPSVVYVEGDFEEMTAF